MYGPIASLWWGPKLTVSIASPELFEQHAKVFDRPGKCLELTAKSLLELYTITLLSMCLLF